MSWRFIFAILILAAGASVWGGLRLGEWLVAHGPIATASPHEDKVATVPVLDADGNPYTAQPPQPLVDGRLAFPEELPQVAWQIPESSIEKTKSNNVIPVATTKITMVEAQQIAASGGSSNRLSGIADVGDLMSGVSQSRQETYQPVQPIEAPTASVAQAPRPIQGANNNAWQARLRQDLQACEAESFFDRPSCAWAARNRYCTPNNAWGRVPDCPARNF